MPVPEPQKVDTLTTASQAAALKSLQRNFAVKCLMPKVGSVKVRTHTLLVGPTGVGKTEVIRRFAGEMGLASMTIPCNSWIPWGAATQPSSLTTVATFIGASDSKKKLLFLDEVDKTVPPGAGGAYGSSWALGVFGEVLALLDGDGRLKGVGWSDEHIARFADVFVVGAGAFQQLATQQKEEDAAANRPQVGFAVGDPVKLDPPHYSRKVNGQGLPPEIASRFAADVVMLEPPTEAEYVRGIIRIHSAFKGEKGKKIPDTEIRSLAKAAVDSNQGMRWFESYCLRLAADAVEKDIPLLKPFNLSPGPFPAPPTGPTNPPAHEPGKKGNPWIKGSAGQTKPPGKNGKHPEPKNKEAAPKADPAATGGLAAQLQLTIPPTVPPPKAAPPPPQPTMPENWSPAVRPMADEQSVRFRALAAARSIRLLMLHVKLHETFLAAGENELAGSEKEGGLGDSSTLALLLGATCWSLEEYWDRETSNEELFGHEFNFNNVPRLVSDLERNMEHYAIEFSSIGMGKVLLEAAAGLREFHIEWDLWFKRETPIGEDNEW
ncbi:MAG: AAA family ATPase [Candidatus Methylacidiphilales bacterium]|nr:AAA family ATPase [Candidatus Methylacidiphilales bacterium]